MLPCMGGNIVEIPLLLVHHLEFYCWTVTLIPTVFKDKTACLLDLSQSRLEMIDIDIDITMTLVGRFYKNIFNRKCHLYTPKCTLWLALA